jgi:hypothetical protein
VIGSSFVELDSGPRAAPERRGGGVLLRGYLAAVLLYVAGHVTLWAVMYRYGRPGGIRETIGVAVLIAMWITFVVVAGRLALAPVRRPVITAAAVSSVAVLTAGWARTAMAALGMWQFLQWDHDNVLAEAAMEEVFVALACFPAAAAVASVSWLIFRWRRRSR